MGTRAQRAGSWSAWRYWTTLVAGGVALFLPVPWLASYGWHIDFTASVFIVAAILVVLSMGVLTYKGATARESLGSELIEAVPVWAERQGFADNEAAVAWGAFSTIVGALVGQYLPVPADTKRTR